MLMLLFHLDGERFAIDCSQVLEIVPVVTFKEVPHVPAHIAGIFNFRGLIVPVVDLCQLIKKKPCRPYLSTRIVLMDYGRLSGRGSEASRQIIGLLAENVTEVQKKAAGGTTPPVRAANAPYLGEIVASEYGEMIQFVDASKLLPDELREILFAGERAVPLSP